ncbi:MAG TPA: T9SS type A sorting domain-containing protein [Bacteroidia bacterium]|jgi:opacity protein-like surface antigen
MKKTNLLLLLTFAGASSMIAQDGTVASGGDAAGAGGTASYSIGQTDYITETGSGNTITQGLQQPYEILVVTGVETKGVDLSLSVYPNPTAEMLILHSDDFSADIRFELSDINGRVIKEGRVVSQETAISVAELQKATYLIKVTKNQQEVKLFKIVKN